MVPSTPLLPSENLAILMGLLMSPPALCILSPMAWVRGQCRQWKMKMFYKSARNLARTLNWPCFVFVAPHCLKTCHRLPSFWMAGFIRQTFQQSVSLPPLLMETLMSSSNSDSISRRHSMIKQLSRQFSHYLQKTVYASITLPTTDGNQVWFTVWLMHPGLTWWLIALVEYSEETFTTYEGLMRPSNFQFLQKKSLRIVQFVTHVLKNSWPAVPLHHLTVLPLPLLVKQTLLLLQFLLLWSLNSPSWSAQRDWTYDCMHCLVFFLY